MVLDSRSFDDGVTLPRESAVQRPVALVVLGLADLAQLSSSFSIDEPCSGSLAWRPWATS